MTESFSRLCACSSGERTEEITCCIPATSTQTCLYCFYYLYNICVFFGVLSTSASNSGRILPFKCRSGTERSPVRSCNPFFPPNRKLNYAIAAYLGQQRLAVRCIVDGLAVVGFRWLRFRACQVTFGNPFPQICHHDSFLSGRAAGEQRTRAHVCRSNRIDRIVNMSIESIRDKCIRI